MAVSKVMVANATIAYRAALLCTAKRMPTPELDPQDFLPPTAEEGR